MLVGMHIDAQFLGNGQNKIENYKLKKSNLIKKNQKVLKSIFG